MAFTLAFVLEVIVAAAAILAFTLICTTTGVEGKRGIISGEADLELERQLKILNKPSVKRIKTQFGEIFDCIDIHKQPAFDHPLLRNHTLKMKPSFIPTGAQHGASQIGLKRGSCPEGTVPIRMTRKEEYMIAKSFLKSRPADINPNDDTEGRLGWHLATIQTLPVEDYAGAQAELNLYNPHVEDSQHSDTLVWVSNGPQLLFNAIYAGWAVNPKLYGDSNTHLYTSWTADKSGCIDIHCPGFVQVSNRIALGMVLPTSTYDGHQVSVNVSIKLDRHSFSWWLVIYGTEYIGYWPQELFAGGGLHGFADRVGWGGYVYSPVSYTKLPEMGSGHLPQEGWGKACFIAGIQYLLNKEDEMEDPDETFLQRFIDTPNCYDIGGQLQLQKPGYHFAFGGPGGNCE